MNKPNSEQQKRIEMDQGMSEALQGVSSMVSMMKEIAPSATMSDVCTALLFVAADGALAQSRGAITREQFMRACEAAYDGVSLLRSADQFGADTSTLGKA